MEPYANTRISALIQKYIRYLTMAIITASWWDFGLAILTSSALLTFVQHSLP